MAKIIGNKSGLEAFLATCDTPQLEDGEWTAKMAHDLAVAKGSNLTYSGMRSKLQRAAQDGEYETRRVMIDGTWVTAYRAKS